MALVVDDIGLRYVVSAVHRRAQHAGVALVLPTKNGREELVNHCFCMLSSLPPNDYANDLMDVIRANSSRDEVLEKWLSHTTGVIGSARTRWLEYGLHLGVYGRIAPNALAGLLSDQAFDVSRADVLMQGRCWSVIDDAEPYFNTCIDALLDRPLHLVMRRSSSVKLLERFSAAILSVALALAISDAGPLPLSGVLKQHGISFATADDDERVRVPDHKLAQPCAEITATIERELALPARTWATELGPWDRVIEAARASFGNRWVLRVLANVAAGIRSSTETCKDYSSLFDGSLSLCRRARYARLRSGSSAWWKAQITSATSLDDKLFCLLLLFTWASSQTLVAVAAGVDGLLDKLDADAWQLLGTSLQDSFGFGAPRARDRILSVDPSELPPALGSRTAAVLIGQVDFDSCNKIYDAYLNTYDGTDVGVLRACEQVALNRLTNPTMNAVELLGIIAKSYASGASYDDYAFARYSRLHEGTTLPLGVVEQVLRAQPFQGHFPRDFASKRAVDTCGLSTC